MVILYDSNVSDPKWNLKRHKALGLWKRSIKDL